MIGLGSDKNNNNKTRTPAFAEFSINVKKIKKPVWIAVGLHLSSLCPLQFLVQWQCWNLNEKQEPGSSIILYEEFSGLPVEMMLIITTTTNVIIIETAKPSSLSSPLSSSLSSSLSSWSSNLQSHRQLQVVTHLWMSGEGTEEANFPAQEVLFKEALHLMLLCGVFCCWTRHKEDLRLKIHLYIYIFKVEPVKIRERCRTGNSFLGLIFAVQPCFF